MKPRVPGTPSPQDHSRDFVPLALSSLFLPIEMLKLNLNPKVTSCVVIHVIPSLKKMMFSQITTKPLSHQAK